MSDKLEFIDNNELESALRESEAQKKAITDGFTGVMIYFDRNHRAHWLNRTVEERYPNSHGKRCHEIFCIKTSSCKDCAYQRSIRTGQIETSTIETGLMGMDGQEVVFEITCSPVKIKPDEVSGLIVIAQNVTEQYRLEKQLRHTQKMEAIGTLAGGVAHDFNNVLTPIMGYTEIIRLKMKRDNAVDPAVFSYLDEILKAAKRAKSLVEQVLTFSRSSEMKEKLLHIHPIVKEVMKLMRVTLPSTIVIVEEVNENCGRLLVDPVKLHQVLINLCTNSAHAMEGMHGVLTVKLDEAETSKDGREWLELSVSDTGTGIDEEIIDRIFEPYFTTKEKTYGTGMGLAMVHGIINRQGGYIKVESEKGKGTTFRVFLPLADKVDPIERVVHTGELPSGVGRILLVDDDSQVVQVTGEILRSLGYTVVGTVSAMEAVDIFAGEFDKFDLVITDLTMPELTGLEVSRKIKKLRSDIPVVLFTGYSDQVSKDAAMEAGVNEYCMKPVSMRNLSVVVDKLLNSLG